MMKFFSSGIGKSISLIVIYLILICAQFLVRAFVLYKLLVWFGRLFRLQESNFFYSLAIVLASSIVLVGVSKNDGYIILGKNEDYPILERELGVAGEMVLRSLMILIFGYICYLFGPK